MIIGASVRRKEDPRLLTGLGKYVGDIRRARMLHAAVVRSPHAHALIRHIDVGPATGLEGVALVATANDLGSVQDIPIRLGPKPSLVPFLQPPLARERVRYVGEPLALVVAADRYAAEDAADRVSVDYEVLPSVASVEEALRPEAPLLHERGGSNLADKPAVVRGEPEEALTAAPVRLRERLTVQRHSAVPMETRGLVADYDTDTGMLSLWGPTKVPHFNRHVLARLLKWPEERIHFLEPDVGGGFGVRGEFYPEDFLIPWAAVRLRRPVKWIEDRREHLLAINHSRQQVHDVELGAERDGRVVALVDRIKVDMGAYMRTHGVTVPELTLGLLPGPYIVPHFRLEVFCVMTNKTPTGTYRSPGRYEANFVRERMMDMLADAVGVDPVEIRRRNFIPREAMPYSVGTTTLGTPTIYDAGDYASALDHALEIGDHAQWRASQARERAAGRCIGIGLASFVEKAGVGPWEVARVEVDPSGEVIVYSGLASLGQGVETALAQICAQELGFSSVDPIRVVHGDTALVADGVGAFASRGAAVGGSAALLASRELKEKVLTLAAGRLEAAREDLMLEDGRVFVRGVPARGLSLVELASSVDGAKGAGPVNGSTLSATHFFEASRMTYPYGTHLAVVEVDPETGRVEVLHYAMAYDVGKAINPMLVEGQLVGGLAQGIGGALLEELVYDDNAQPLTVSFMDYLLPTAMEMPRQVTVKILEETPTPLNPLGVKGAGEGGTAGAGAAIANAVSDALRPWKVQITDLPVTPDRILRALQRAGA